MDGNTCAREGLLEFACNAWERVAANIFGGTVEPVVVMGEATHATWRLIEYGHLGGLAYVGEEQLAAGGAGLPFGLGVYGEAVASE